MLLYTLSFYLAAFLTKRLLLIIQWVLHRATSYIIVNRDLILFDSKLYWIFLFQQKQRCPALEELLVELIVVAMERSEENEASMSETGCQLLWHHLSSHLIFFVLFQFASFPHMVLSLYTKVHSSPIPF